MDRRIKFRHLEAVVEIARAKSLRKAAEVLHLTQPAISRTLKELEDILGTPLMERGRAGVRLTPAGEVFVQAAAQSLGAVRQGISTLQAVDTGAAQVLTLGALPSVAAQLLPPSVARFRQAAPGVLVQVREGPHGTLTDLLRQGALDLVVGRLGRPETMAGLSFTQLYSETVVVVVARGHPLAGATRIEDLQGFPILYPPKDSAIRPLVARAMIAQGLPLFEDRIETVSGAFGRAMTLGPEQAVWFISHGVVAGDLAAGRMVRLPIEMSQTKGPVGIMARSEDSPTPAARLFRKVLLAQAGLRTGDASTR